MKQFISVLQFELSNFFKNKTYLITTVLISVLLIVGLSLPSFIDFDFLKDDNSTKVEEKNDDKITLGIYNKNDVIKDISILEKSFNNVTWKEYTDEEDMKKDIKDEDIKGAFSVKSLTDYTYYVNNSSMDDSNEKLFTGVLKSLYRESEINKLGLDYNKVEEIYNADIKSDVKILGKDSVSNFLYTYGLIFIIYMMIVLYGQLVATSVTTEKSNRAIEVLVTSTSTNSLIFGKVIAGVIASIIQVAAWLGSAIITYSVNSGAWNNKLDFIFNIPYNVLIVFAVFGILGFLLYCFIYAVLGALVSKTEDLGKSCTSVTMILVVVFILSMSTLSTPDSLLSKVLSYVPFSSCFSMFLRVGMGSVSIIEVIISLAILVVSIIVVGILGSKIYRLGTLMIGNPIKLSNALKTIKRDKKPNKISK